MLLVLEGILGAASEESWIRRLTNFVRLGEVSEIFRIFIPECETPEALMLGLDPRDVQLNQGPLTVASLGWDPPERSLHFHLSLLSYSGILAVPKSILSVDEENVVREKLKLLNSRLLTTLWGHGFNHGLVWERLAEIRTKRPEEITTYYESLPEGDGEQDLRRFIDDSVNVLHEEEFNLRRIDRGVEPINIAWPWGNGLRLPVPNLALRYGYPFRLDSSSMRLAGLARLAGFRHGRVGELGTGLQSKFSSIQYEKGTVVVISAWSDFRALGMIDEGEYLARRADQELISRILDDAKDKIEPLWVVLTGTTSGLGVRFSGKAVSGKYPLDERSLDEKLTPRVALQEFTRGFYTA